MHNPVIDPSNPAQLEWIVDYIGRTQPGFTLTYRPGRMHQLPGRAELIAAIDARMGDPLFRERYRKMQNAWRQKKARSKKDRQAMAHQLPVSVLATLDKLAKQRNQAKVRVLSEVIEDAWHDHQRATARAQKDKAAYQKHLKAQRVKYQQTEHVYQRVVEALLDALAENLDQRCLMEAIVGELVDHASLEEADVAAYRALMHTRLVALDNPLHDLTRLRFKGEPLRKRVMALTLAREEALPKTISKGEA